MSAANICSLQLLVFISGELKTLYKQKWILSAIGSFIIMNSKKKYLSVRYKTAVALPVLMALSACGSGDGDTLGEVVDSVIEDAGLEDVVVEISEPEDEVDAVAPGGPGACPIVGNLTPVELAPGECQIGGQLTENGVLTSDQTWFLEGALQVGTCLLYTSPSPRDGLLSRMPSSA